MFKEHDRIMFFKDISVEDAMILFKYYIVFVTKIKFLECF